MSQERGGFELWRFKNYLLKFSQTNVLVK